MVDELALVFLVLKKVEKLITFVTRHALPLPNVEQDVRNIKSELESIRSSHRKNESTKVQWLKDIREVEYEIEEVIDCFELHQQKSKNPVKKLEKLIHSYHVASRIKSIKEEVHRISVQSHRFPSNDGASSSCCQHHAPEVMEDPRDSSPETSINNTVGINDSREDLVDLLRDGRLVGMPRVKDWLEELFHSKRGTPMVISVVGMSGIGKTLLIRQVYDSKKVKKYFKCRAWIKVPETCTTTIHLLRLIISELHKKKRRPDPQGLPSMDRHRLVETLKSLHLKRYLLVLDDVWHVDELHVIKDALPSHRNGSRVIVTTTRRRKVRAYDHVHEVKPLQSDDAEKLLRESAFSPNHGSIPPQPPQLSSEKILEKCEGLPLAIVTIGNLLWQQQNTGADVIELWESVLTSLASESKECSIDESSALSKLWSILTYRYNGLPHHLKSCLMYLGIFPDGQLIKRVKLIQQWIAEGFVEENEEEADRYLNELTDYNMIQVAKRRSYNGKVKSYKVHPLMRKFLVLKAKEQNLYVFSTERKASSTVKIRRLSISGDDMNGSQDLSHVRSFFAFKSNQSLVEGFCSKFKYLRVLDLENAPLTKFPESLVKLKFLRYLSLANTDIRSLPKTIRKLKIMRVLNLKRTLISQLPEEIEKLTQLRQLSIMYRSDAAGAPSVDDVQAVRVPRGIRGLVALQKLSMIQVNGEDHIVLSELGNLTQLRRLGVGGLRREDGRKICSSIQQMKNLNSLSLNSRNVDEPLELEYDDQFSSPPPHLQRLHLQGRLSTLPGWILNLTRLKCLTLGGSHFKHDPFQELVALTALKELTLLEAYDGNELNCIQSGNGSGFPNLELLSLNGLHRLEAIHLEGAMPNLQKIIIKSCKELRTVPLEIKYLPVLKEVELSDVSAALMSSIQNAKQLKHVKLSIGISRNVYRATEAIATDFWRLKERQWCILIPQASIEMDNQKRRSLALYGCLNIVKDPFNC
ncbi:disease resistance protein RPM1-like protein [Cinnamomum micranthum f. kanehirae]|uniref:Disease resistance protein RPM1-like protein n=1 Tax=Cinnamomum micranthum f. kanehirae TaxID=337451 RepID=A0A3S3NJZ2_9MAGN|nr:disease resistance protein RPM1-like protein [Cinnamomum micranthum f. kanehirae]